MESSVNIAPLRLAHAGERELAQFNAFSNRMLAERWPDEPPISLEDHRKRWRAIASSQDIASWAAWRAERQQIVASGSAILDGAKENGHLASFTIEVLPEFRRRGIARRLLGLVAEVAVRENRRLLTANTSGLIPAGEAFMKRLGARKGLDSHLYRLDLATLDRSLIERWKQGAQERAPNFELGCWDGPYPAEQLEAISALFAAIDFHAWDTLGIKDNQFSLERLRQTEKTAFESGRRRWTMYAREKSTGRLAGFTTISSRGPNRLQILMENNTGVLPEYRNKGLGRWLKAAMLDKILRECPEAKFIETANANANDAMLKIKLELGYRPYASYCIWQVETRRALEYLSCRVRA